MPEMHPTVCTTWQLFVRTWLLIAIVCVLGPGCASKEPSMAEKGSFADAAASDIPTLIDRLENGDIYEKREAASMLGEKGAAAMDACPALLDALKEKDSRLKKNAADALIKIKGKNDLDTRLAVLASQLGWKGWITPKKAAQELSEMGEKASGAVESLITVVTNKDNWSSHYRKVKKEAIKALGNIGHHASQAVPSLIQMMDDIDINIRREAIRTLGKIGPDAARAVPYLKTVCEEDPSEVLREEAVLSLGKMEASLETFESAFSDENPRVRAAAMTCSVANETLTPSPIPYLIEGLSDPVPRVREASASALGRIPEIAGDAVPVLKTALEDRDYGVRKAAANALKIIDPHGAEDTRMKVLATQLEDKGRSERKEAVETLAASEFQPEKTAPLLIQALQGKSRSVRQEAARSLGKLGYRSEAVLDALTDAMKNDPAFQVRSEAAAALGRLGASDELLASGLDDRVSYVRLNTVKALVDSETKGHFQGVLSWAPDEEADVRGYLVCYGTETGKYPHCRDVGNATEFNINELKLPKDHTYYLVIKAYNSTGLGRSSQEIVVSQTETAEKLIKMIQSEENEMVKKQAEEALETIIKNQGP